MKKNLRNLSPFIILVIFLLSIPKLNSAQSITVTGVSPTSVCAGSTVTITFTVTNGNGAPKAYKTTTSYQIYLSNASGNTFSPVGSTFYNTSQTAQSGNNKSTPGFTQSFTIPSGTSVGSGYKISIGSSNPNFDASSGAGASSSFTVTSGLVITTQPSTSGQTLCVGSTATPLTVAATGTGISYQWYSNTTNSNVGGISLGGGLAQTATYTPSTSNAGTLYYYVMVSTSCGNVTSSVSGPVTVNPLATSTDPSNVNQTVCQNAAVPTLSVTATGVGLSYQWYINTTNSNSGGTLISGATASSYTPTTSIAGTFYYYVTVNSTCGTATSHISGWELVNPITAITTQPSTTIQNLCSGSSATALSVTAAGSSLNYQWYSNTTNSNSGGTAIGGATSSTYTPNSSSAGTNYYYVKVTGTCGTVTSNVSGAVIVNALPFTTDPSNVNQTICSNSPAPALSVTATGTGISYQWYSNTTNNNSGGTLVSGANSSTYTPNTSVAGKFYYYVVVSGVCTPVATSHTSGSCTILAQPTANITGNASFCAGNSTILSSNATAGSGNISSYQWNLNGSPISGATSSTYTATSGGSYTVTVTNSNGCSFTSNGFSVSVNALPTISGNGSVCVGGTTQLTGSGSPAASNPWVSGTPGIATINSTGLVTGVSIGSSVITYTNNYGCSITSLMATSPLPVTTGVTICQGGTGTISALACTAVGANLVGPKDPGTAVSGGGPSITWSSTSNVLLNDGLFATSNLSGGKSTQPLNITNYGFSIPSTAVITGVKVTMSKYADGTSVQDTTVRLIIGGNASGNNYTITSSYWPTTPTAFTYGSLNDLWGNTLTPAIVNASNFGVSFATTNTNGPVRNVYVDYVEISITYAMPGTLNWYTVSSGGSPIGSGSPFNPAGVSGSGLANTNTPGTTLFYAECSSVPGCRTSASFTINTSPTVTIAGTTSFCSGGSSVLTANATAGSGTITGYQWNLGGTPISGATSSTYTATTAGSYTVVVTNSIGCSTTSSATVVTVNPIPSAPTASITSQPTCSLSTGIITISAPTGTGMTYSTDGINYINTTGLFPGMSPGTYSLTAKNSSGCISSANSVTVNAQPATPAAPTASVTAQPSCSVATGTITITAPTGTGMTYSTDGITFTNTTGIFSGMAAGTYTVKARNSSGCTSSATSVTVNAQPATPAAPTASVTAQPTCSVATGTITITAPTGTGMTYSTDGITFTNTTGIFSGMAAGTYSVTAKNSSGCISSATSVTVNAQPATPAAPTASVTVQPSCSVATGTITITAPTGTGMTYSTDGITFTNTTGIFSGMAAGTYNVNARNSSGCTSSATSVTVNAQPASPAAPTASVTAQPTCSVATGTITITAPTGTGMTYSTDGVTYTNTNGIFTGMAAGTYNVKARNSIGCTSSATSVTVNNPPVSVSASISGASTICTGSSATLTITATGTGTINGTLSDGTVFNGTAPTVSVAVSPTVTTTYTIATLTNGTCAALPANLTGTAAVVVTAAPSATISYPGSPYCSNSGSASITLAGTTGGTFTISPSGATIDPASGTVNLAATASGTYTVTYTVAATSGCSLFSASTQIVVNPNTWKGLISSDWHAAGNWAGTLSAGCPTITIAAGGAYNPIINSGTVSIQNLVINNGASLTVSGGSLQIGGTITNNGKFVGSVGTVELNGTSPQTIAANAFYGNNLNNLIISNTSAAGVSIAGPLNILGSVTFTGTGKVLNTNDFLTFKSNASGTAWLGNMTGNTLNGKATVERYISAQKGWKFLSIPTNTGQTIQQTWQEGCGSNANCTPGFGTQITGAGGTAAGFDMTSPSPSMKTYNPATNAWVGVPNTNSTIIKATDGYMVFVRGDRSVTTTSAAPTSTVLRTKGYIYQGDQPTISVQPGKFAAIGNPYPSAIDMRNIVKTGLKDFFYLWDPSIAGLYGYGGYQTFSNDGSGDYIVTPGGGDYGPSGGISNYIQSGQAFFVQAGSSGGSLTFKEDAKTTGSRLVSTPATLPLPYLRTNLYGVNADSSTYMADGILVNYGDNYSNAVDDMDAIKSTNTSENLSSKTANTLLVIERRHTITSKDTIHLNLTGVKVQNYRFEVMAGRLSQPGLTGYLIDNYLHTSTPLNIDGTTLYNFTIANIAASYAANRFEIVFSQYGTLPVTFTTVKAYQQNKNINVEWKVENEMNIKQYEVEKSMDGNSFITMTVTPATANGGQSASYGVVDSNPAQGYNYYRIKSVDVNGQEAYSTVVNVKFGGIVTNDIIIYPNPIVGGIIQLKLINQPQGIYQVRVIDQLGQQVLSKKIVHNAGTNTETVQMDNDAPKGVYQVQITDPLSQTKVIQIIY